MKRSEVRSYISRLGQVSRLLPFLLGGMICSSVIFANPVLDNVSHGQVSISQTPGTTTVNQTSQQAIINWHSFNIGAGEATHFQQPAGGAALNRINPNNGASNIYGTLTSTGRIILSNPAGIYFGPNAFVNVGGLIATTMDMSDQDFLSGNYHFSQVDGFNGTIVNQGHIVAAEHGLVALVGGAVTNDGMIEAHLGNVILASGSAVTMSFAGNDLVNFTVDGASANAKIENSGSLIADGGKIMVSAKSTQAVLDNVINMQGVVQAKSVGLVKGELIISGSTNGIVRIAGKLDASGKNSGESGGNITVTGKYILLDTLAELDVSGDLDAGHAWIGGNYKGAGPLQNAARIIMMDGAKIFADSITNGNGGEVILWSDDYTQVFGSVFARGGANGGNGGFIETSGKDQLHVGDSFYSNTTATYGTAGTWLLDPQFVVIGIGGSATLAQVDQFSDSPAGTANLANTTITASAGTIQIQANTDITVNSGAPVNMTNAGGFAWRAGRSILINANLTVTSPFQIILTANDSGAISANRTAGNGDISIAAGVTINAPGGVQLTIGPSTGSFTPGTVTLNATANLTSAAGSTSGVGFSIPSGTTSTISGTISGTGGIVKVGLGTLVLTAASNYTGPTLIEQGTVSATVVNAFGTGNGGIAIDASTVFTNTTMALDLSALSATIGNTGPITMNSNTQNTAFLTFANTYTFTNAISITGLTNNTITQSSGNTTLSGVISGAGAITKAGTGTITLSNTSNSYSLGTVINAGNVNISAVGGLGSGATTVNTNGTLQLSMPSSSTLTNGAAITINGTGSAATGAILFSNSILTLSNNIILGSDAAIGTSVSSSILNGIVSGAFNFTKLGIGDLYFGGANTYSGTTTVSGTNGALFVQNVGGLGNGSAGSQTTSVTVTSTNTLGMIFASGSLTNTTASFNLSGAGGTYPAALFFNGSAGAQTISNPITLAANTTIRLNSATNGAVMNSTINGAFTLTFTTAGSALTLNGLIGGTTPLTSLTVNPALTLGSSSIRTTGAQTYAAAVGLNTDTTLTSTSSGVIAFNSTLNSITSARNLTVSTANGNITFTGAVGATLALATLKATTGTAPNDISFGSTLAVNAVADSVISSSRNVTFANNVSSTAASIIYLRADNTGTGTGTVTFTTGNITTVSGQVHIYYNPTTFGTQDTIYTGGTPPTNYMLVQILGAATDTTTRSLASLSNNAALVTAGKNYALAKDIDASATSSWNSGSGFLPIANYAGNFDGLGYRISGLTINRSGTNNIALFGTITGSTTVLRHINLINVNIIGAQNTSALLGSTSTTASISNIYVSGTISGTTNVGGIIGVNNNVSTSFINSVNQANVTGTGVGMNIGGLVGASNGGTASGLVNLGNISGVQSVGGVYGFMNLSTAVTDSYSTGNVTSSGNFAGGFVGTNSNSSSITRSYSTGLVTSSFTKGGFVGTQITSATITASFWDTETSGLAAGFGTNTGGTLTVTGGCFTGSSCVNGGTANLSASATYSGAGFSIGTDPSASTWVIITGSTRPMHASEYRYDNSFSYFKNKITTAHALQLIQLSNTTRSRNYTLGYDVTATGTKTLADVWGTTISNARGGFIPIGSSANQFTGNMTGAFAIKDIYIYQPSGNGVGLFGYVNTNALVQQVGVEGAVTGLVNVGGLVGINDGTLTNVYSTAAITAGNSAINVGSLAGVNNGTITFAYGAGSMTIGSSPTNIGGFVGSNNGTFSNDYWDTTTTGRGTATGTGSTTGTTGNTTANMELQASYSGWDFTNIWKINSGTSYPYFLSSSSTNPPVPPPTFTIVIGSTLGSGVTVNLLINGAIAKTAVTVAGGNSTFNILFSELSQTQAAIAYVSGNTTLGNFIFSGTDTQTTFSGASYAFSGTTSTVNVQTLTNGSLTNTAIVTARGSIVNTGLLFTASGSNLDLTAVSGRSFSVSASSTYSLNGNITTAGGAGAITFNNPITVSANSTLTTTGGNIILNTVNSNSAGTNNLTLSTGAGSITLSGPIGTTTSLANFSATNTGGSNNLALPATTTSTGITLSTGGAVSQTGILNTGTLTITSGTGINLFDVYNNTISNFTANNSGGSTGIQLVNTAATLTITAGGLTESGSGGIFIRNNGNITLTGNVNTGSSTRFDAAGSNSLLSINGSVTSTSGTSYNADNMSLVGTTNAGSGFAQLNAYNSSSTSINLGGADSAGVLGLTNTELNTITNAGILHILTADGNILISNPISIPVGVNTLSLYTISSGTITQSAGATITANNVNLKSVGSITLTENNSIGTLGAEVTGASNILSITNVIPLTLNFVYTASGLVTNNGNITLSTAGLTMFSNINAGTATANITSTGTITGSSAAVIANTLTLTNTSANTTLNNASNNIAVLGTINAAGRIFTLTNNRASGVTQSGALTASTLNFTNTSGSSTLTNTSNAVSTFGTIDATGQTFNFANSVALTQSGILTATNFSISSSNSVNLNQNNVISTLAAALSGSTFGFTFNNASGALLTIGSVNSINGVSTNNGAINIVNDFDLTVSDTAAANDINAGTSTLALSTTAANRVLTLNTSAVVTGSGGITYTSDNMTLTGTTAPVAGSTTLLTTSAATVIRFGGAATDAAGFLGLSQAEISTISGTGTITIGNVSNTGGITTVGGGTLDTARNFVFTTNTTFLSNAVLGGTTPLTSLTITAPTSISLAANITTTGTQTYNSAVTLGANMTLTTTNTNITFNSTIDSLTTARDLTLTTGTGVETLSGNIGSTLALGAVNLNGTGAKAINGTFNAASLVTNPSGTVTISGGSVTTSGSQSYGNAVLLSADTIFTSTGSGNLNFTFTLNSSGSARNVTFNTGGETFFDATLGGTLALATITTDAPGTTRIGALALNTSAIGGMVFNDAVSLDFNNTTSPIALNATNGGAITFNGTVGTIGTFGLTLTTTGATTFANGLTGAVSALLITAGTSTTIGANMTSTGTQTYNSPVLLNNDVIFTTTNSAVTFNSTIDSLIAARNLTISAGSGAINLTSNIGSTLALGATTLNSSGATTIGGTINAASLTTNASGTTVINSSTITTSAVGGIVFNDPISLGNNTVTLQANNGGAITFANTLNSVTSARNLILNTTGTTTFSGIVGATLALLSLTTDAGGTTAINTTAITTSGAAGQVFNDNVTLGANVSLTANTSGAITFGGILDSSSSARTLDLNTTGATTFNGAVGSLLALSTLTTNAGGTTAINGGAITTSAAGGQVYNDAVTLGADTTLAAGTGAINFASTVDSSSSTRTLTLNATGATTLSGVIGGTLGLTSLTTNTGGTLVFGAAITGITTTGSQSYGENATVTATNLTFTAGGNIAFNGNLSAVTAATNLSLVGTGSSGNNFTLGGTFTNFNVISITGGSGTNTFTVGTNAAKTFTITAGNAGNVTGLTGVNTITFAAIGSLTGGASTDTFILNGGTLSGAIDGAAGSDSLTGSNATNNWVVNATNGGTVSNVTGGFTGIETLIGGNATDNWTVSAGTISSITDTSGSNTLTHSGGTITGATSIAFTGPTQVNTSVTTTGTQTYTGAVTLLTNTTFTTTNNDVVFGSTVNSIGSAQDFIVSTGSGAITLTGNAGAGVALNTVTLTNTGTTTIGGTVNAASVTTNGAGATNINGNITTSGAQTYNDSVTVSVATTTFTAGGNINFVGTLSGATAGRNINLTGTGAAAKTFTLANTFSNIGTITANAGSGTNNLVVSTPAAKTFTISGTSTGDVTGLTGLTNIAFSNFSTLTGGSSTDNFVVGSIGTFAGGTVDGSTGTDTLTGKDGISNTWNVTSANGGTLVNTDGTITFAGIENLIGGNSTDTYSIAGNMTSLTDTAGSNVLSYTSGTLGSIAFTGVTQVNTVAVTTTGTQTYTGALTFNNNITFTTTNNNVVFGSTVNGLSAGLSFSVSSGTGAITLTGNMGNTLVLGAVSLTNTGTTTIGGTVNAASVTTSGAGTTAINGGSVITSGAQTYNDNVTLGADTTFTSTGTANILFAGTLSSVTTPRNLIVNATNGTITFTGAVGGAGGTAALASIQAKALVATRNIAFGSTTQISGTNPNYIVAGGSITLANSMTQASSGAINLRADYTGSGTGTVTVTTGNITASGGVNIYYNPTTFGTQNTIYSGGTTPTQYMLVLSLGNSNDAATTRTLGALSNNSSLWTAGKNYALASNIDASATLTWNSGSGFTPIGVSGSDYSGNFDGLGNIISNLYINRPTTNEIALFGRTLTGTTIKNLGVINANISGGSNVSAIVAQNNSTLINVYSTGIITGTSNLGGLVGTSGSSGSISNSWSGATVTGNNGGNNGGLVGVNAGTISNSYSYGAVTGSNNNIGGLVGSNSNSIINSYSTSNVIGTGTSIAGGLVGLNSGASAIITNSYSTGTVSGTTSGGFVGTNSTSASITNSFWDTETSGKAAGFGSNTATITNLTGGCFTGTACTNGGTANLSATTTYSSAPYSWNIGTNLASNTWVMIDSITRPMLAMEYKTDNNFTYFTSTVQSAHALQLIALNASTLAASYTLGANIDASKTTSASDVGGSAGFYPIGNNTTNFTGVTFAGSNYVINGLYINRPSSSFVGLFGAVNGTTISSLGMTNVNITGNGNVGALAGSLGGSGTLSDSYSTGTVKANAANAGGLIGLLQVAMNSSFSSANVTSTSNQVGGLVGLLSTGGSITTSYSAGNVIGITDVGGFIGQANGAGTVTNVYSLGAVTGTTNVGGFIGNNQGTVNISRAYSTGAVTGTTAVGGFVGQNAGTITISFWDTDTSTRATGFGSNSGTITNVTGGCFSGTCTNGGTANLSAATTYSSAPYSWSVSSVVSKTAVIPAGTWFVFPGDTRPFLMAEYKLAIVNTHQLQAAATTMAANYTLAADIDFTSVMNNKSEIWGTNRGISSGQGFYPIGRDSQGLGNGYTGNFDGLNHTITNFYAWRPTDATGYVALFGSFTGAGKTIQNIGMINPYVSGLDGAGLVGAFGSGSTPSVINNVYVSGGVIVGTDFWGAGGLVGWGNSTGQTITNSWSSASVTGKDFAGGLIGDTYFGNVIISNSYSTGAVSSTTAGAKVGGLIGEAWPDSGTITITNSYATGNVTSTATGGTGGLIGYIQPGSAVTITNTYASGVVTAPSNKGGLIAINANGAGTTVTNSFWDVTTSGLGTDGGTSGSAGGIGKSTANLRIMSTYTSWNIGTNLASNIWVMIDGKTRPMLAMEYTRTLVNAHQVQLVGLNTTTLAGSYTIHNDIDMSGTSNASDVWATSIANGGAGFVPIGDATTHFMGNITGGYTLTDIYVNQPSGTNVGLFGFVDANATVAQVAVSGKVIGLTNVGGLIGTNAGKVNNVFSLADVVAGANSTNVGGLIGNNTGAVSFAYSAGRVTVGSSPTSVGGFVGATTGTITNSYWDTDASTKTDGYGSGSTTGLFGGCFNGTCTIQPSANSNNVGAAVNMSLQATYTGWDFATIWSINPTITYPYFKNSSYKPPYAPTTYSVVITSGLSAGTTVNLLINGAIAKTALTITGGSVTFALTLAELNTTTAAIAYVSGNTTLGNFIFSGTDTFATYSGVGYAFNTSTANAQTLTNGSLSNSTIATARGSIVDTGLLFAASGNDLTFTNGNSFTTASGSNYTLNGNISTSGAGGNITFNNAITMSSNAILTGAIISTAAINNGGFALTISNSGASSISGTLSGAGSLTKSGTGILTLSGVNGYTGITNINAGTLSISAANNLGSTTGITFAGGTLRTTASLSLTPNITLSAGGGTFDINSGTLILGGTINGANNLTLGGAGTGITLNGIINIASLTSNIATTMGANITTTGNQTYNNPVILAANVITAAGSGDINFASTVNGTFALTANSTGITTFGGVVGTTALTSLTTNAGGTTVINGGAITTSAAGGQVYNDNVTLGAATTFTTTNNNISFGGTVNGAQSFVIAAGAGTVTFTGAIGTTTAPTTLSSTGAGAVTFGGTVGDASHRLTSVSITGNVTANGGAFTTGAQTYAALTLSGASVFDSSASTINFSGNVTGGNQALTLNVAGTTSAISGVISNVASLTKGGSGTLTLGANTYSTTTTISAGILSVTTNTSLGSSTVNVNNTGTLQLTGSTFTLANNINFNAGGTIIDTGSNSTSVLSGVVTLSNAASSTETLNIVNSNQILTINSLTGGNASGNMILSGAGTLLLPNANSYIGTTTMNAGAVDARDNLSFGTSNIALNNAAILATGTGLTIANNIAFGGTSNTFNISPGTTSTFTGVWSGNATFVKSGTGTLTLGGVAVNTFSGTTTINAGTLNLAKTGALGNAAITVNAATLTVTGTAVTLSNAMNLNNNSVLLDNNANGRNIFSGGLTLSGTNTINVANNTSILTLSGAIGGSSTLAKTGTGTLVLSNNNSYTGTTTVSAGILNLQHSAGFGTSAVTVATSATLFLANPALTVTNGFTFQNNSNLIENNVNGNNTLSGILALSGTLNVNTANAVNDKLTLSGNITGTSITLNKSGLGTLVLAGNKTYTGTTNIATGSLNVTTSSAAGSSAINVRAGTTFAVVGTGVTVANNINLFSGGTILDSNVVGGNTLSGNIVITGSSTFNVGGSATNTLTLSGTVSGTTITLNKTGIGTLLMTQANTYTGTTNVNTGQLAISGSATALSTSTVNVNENSIFSINAALGANFTNALNLTNATLLNNGTNTLSGNNLVLSGNNTINSSGSLTLAKIINGSGSLTFNNAAGTIIVSGTNNYSGAIILSNGTLTASNASALGTGILNLNGGTLTTSGAFTLANSSFAVNGSTIIGGSNNITLPTGVLNASSQLTVTNSATTNFAGSVSGGGSLIINGGTTQMSASNASFSGGITLTSGTLQVNSTNASALGTGVLTLNGGTLLSNVANTIANNFILGGNTTLNGSANITFSGAGVLLSGNTLTIGNTATITFNGALSGAGNITLASAGTVNFASNSAGLSGLITLNSGTATVTNSRGIGSASVTINAGATLNINNVSLANNKITMNGSSGQAATLSSNGVAGLGGAITLSNASFNNYIIANDGTFILTNNINGFGDLLLLGNAIQGQLVSTVDLSSPATGNMVIMGEVGNTTALRSIRSNVAVTFGGTDNITVGDQYWSAANPITLIADAKFISLAGNVTIDAAINGNFPLTIKAAGVATVNGGIGNLDPVQFITIMAPTIYLNGGNIISTGTQNYNGAVVLGNNTTFTALGLGSTINFTNTFITQGLVARTLNVAAATLTINNGIVPQILIVGNNYFNLPVVQNIKMNVVMNAVDVAPYQMVMTQLENEKKKVKILGDALMIAGGNVMPLYAFATMTMLPAPNLPRSANTTVNTQQVAAKIKVAVKRAVVLMYTSKDLPKYVAPKLQKMMVPGVASMLSKGSVLHLRP